MNQLVLVLPANTWQRRSSVRSACAYALPPPPRPARGPQCENAGLRDAPGEEGTELLQRVAAPPRGPERPPGGSSACLAGRERPRTSWRNCLRKVGRAETWCIWRVRHTCMGTAGLITFSPRTLPGRKWGARSGRGNPEVGIPGASPLAHPGNSSHVKSFHLPTPPNGVSPHGKQLWESLRELPNVSDPAEG